MPFNSIGIEISVFIIQNSDSDNVWFTNIGALRYMTNKKHWFKILHFVAKGI